VDVGALLQDVAAETPAHHLDIDLDTAPGATAVGNSDHLHRLFRTLIDNAVRYAHSRVVITSTITADGIRVEIDDDGPGIPVADRERVFDRFVRLDHSRERGTGTTGLGLAIAREIALAHHGRITIQDSLTGGTRLTITLPIATSGAPSNHVGTAG
jgi:signal transduction histidine kinase